MAVSTLTPSALMNVANGCGTVTTSAERAGGRWIARHLGLAVGAVAPASLTVEPTATGEQWTRRFGDDTWTSSMSCDGAQIRERHGPIEIIFRASRGADGRTQLRSVGSSLGPLPLPHFVDICANVRRTGTSSVTVVEIALLRGRAGRCRYVVRLEPPGLDVSR